MNTTSETSAADIELLVAEVADRFTDDVNQGRSPSIEAYAQRHPQIAHIIRQVFPALAMLDDSSPTWSPDRKEDGQIAGVLGDFRLVREIGRGGMGVVYEAVQISLGRTVALKVLPFAAMLDKRQLTRFRNEARAAAALHHNNIVPVFSVGCERGVHYYAMQFIEGESLASVIAQISGVSAWRFPSFASRTAIGHRDTVADNGKTTKEKGLLGTSHSDPVSFTGGFTGADLSVTDSGPATSNEGDNLTFTLTVKNNGPSAATNVVLTDTLGANLSYISATKSQGSFTRTGSVVKFSFGTVAVGQTVTATVTAQAIEDGNLTNSASVTASQSDANLANNSATATTAVAEPPIVVSGPITVSGKNQNNIQVATFTHANGVEPVSDFVATINWGDGTTSTGSITQSGSTYKVKGSHTYSGNGSHIVTTTVVETESGGGALHSLALVNNSAPGKSASSTPAARQSQTTAAVSTHPILQPLSVDQVLTTTMNRSRRALHGAPNDAALDDLFALA